MTFKIDYREGDVYRWTATESGTRYTRDTEFTPTIYVSTDDETTLENARQHLRSHPDVASVAFERYRTVWRNDPETVLRLGVETLAATRDLAHDIRGWGRPGAYKLYNVDFTREFRYCLENDHSPVPGRELDVLEFRLPPKELNDGRIVPLTIDGREITSSERDVLDEIVATLEARDPDVLVVSSSTLIPLLYRKARQYDIEEFELGRLPGWQELAAASTFESYGRVGHSPARYNVFGRVIIDTSNSFFWRQTNLAGLLDLVDRSWKPLQETAWASIGNVLTSIQIRLARDRRVLVPWNSWRHEAFKPMSTLHEADRGGFIFAPEVGVHETVHELDFSSLYPNIMVTRNISPDTIRCECHRDRRDIPGLGYSVCDADGFLGDVLEPIIADREKLKSRIARADDDDRIREFAGRSAALKWILVSCFGYQGFSNAKFGRIECHEAINAVAREILLDTKSIFERHGWRVIHGIVDSVWVQADPNASQTPLEEVASIVSEAIEIPLEYEAEYDWIAFAPRKDSSVGALNRYFGKIADSSEFKKRGIELRQRSTPKFIRTCQTEWLETLDQHRSAPPVCDQLEVHLARLRAGAVDPTELLIRRRVSKSLDEYTQYTQSVSALERAETQAFDVAPGEDIEYVVVDDDKQSQARVRLAYESPDRYDSEFYSNLLLRAAESVLSPLGWDSARIKRYLEETEDAAITAY